MQVYGHPFSSYCQKVFIALYENATPSELRLLTADDADTAREHAELWPLKKMPVLVDGSRTVVEASIIIEYLDLYHRGPVVFVPDDHRRALDVRMMDRCFDNYVMTPMQRIVFDFIRPPERRDPDGVAEARSLLDTAYRWLDGRLRDGEWAVGDAFTLADCAGAPALLYADWVHPIAEDLTSLHAYRQRLLARPSVTRAVDEARPHRSLFPPGAPDRD